MPLTPKKRSKAQTREPEASTKDAAEPTNDEGSDTEGHTLFVGEFGRSVGNSRVREAQDWARGEKARKEADRTPKRRGR